MKPLTRFNVKGLTLILLPAILFFTGCKKERTPGPKPVVHKIYQVVNTGSVFDTELRSYKAACWLNENFYPLESVPSEETGAYGIGIDGANIYVAGFYVEKEIMHPCYWYKGKQIKLKLGSGGFWRATAVDVVIYRGKLYLLGSVDLVPTIWVVEGDKIVQTVTLKTLPNAIGDELRGSNRLVLSDNKLYLGAAQLIDQKNGKTSVDVGYWTIDGQAVNYTTLAPNLPYARVYSLAVHQGQIALSGESVYPNGETVPVIWASGGNFSATQKLNPNTQRIGAITADNKGNLLAMVSNTTFSPQMAEMNWARRNELSFSSPGIPATAKGNVKALDYREKLAFSCSYLLENRYQAVYWLDQKLMTLQIPDKHQSYVNLTGIKLFEAP